MSSSSCSIPKRVSAETNPNWLELPTQITSNILQRLGAVEILTIARNVCPYWWNICKDPLMWRTIRMSDIHMLRYNTSTLSKICCCAVDQSCGRLEDLHIKYFGNDDIIKYAADRGSQLRRIRIEQCQGSLSKEGLSEAVKKLPLLEEIDISQCHLLYRDSFDIIGQSCPLLKTLRLEISLFQEVACDKQAYGIAETMHGLCHLEILKNSLSNDGLLAILDGCPLLESLDLRGCRHLDLSGSIGQRCKKQIKNLRLPAEFIDEPDDTCGDIDLTILYIRYLAADMFRGIDFSHIDKEFEMESVLEMQSEMESMSDEDFY